MDDNRIRVAKGSSSGIGVSGTTNSAVVAHNSIAGAPNVGVGVAMDRSTGCQVLGNDFHGLAATAPDIVLTDTTSRCLVVTLAGDTVIDQGTHNRVIYR